MANNNFFHNAYKKNQKIIQNEEIKNKSSDNSKNKDFQNTDNINDKKGEIISGINQSDVKAFDFSSFSNPTQLLKSTDTPNDKSKKSNSNINQNNKNRLDEKVVKPFNFTKISREEMFQKIPIDDKTDDEQNSKTNNDIQFDKNSLENFKKEHEKNKTHIKKEISKRKASAIYLISLGTEKASIVAKQFSEEEKNKLFKEIAKIDRITQDEYFQTESLFGKMSKSYEKIVNGKEFLRELMLKLFGVNDGSVMFIKIAEEAEKDDFEYINKLDTEQFMELMSNEPEYIWSVVLSLLDTKKASEIVKKLSTEKAAKILKMMSGKLNINTDTFKIIVQKMNERAKEIIKNSYLRIQGKKKLIEIIKNADIDEAETIINKIEKEDIELAEELRENIFTFTDILKLDKKELEKVLKDYDNSEIAYLLKGADDNIKTIFLTCVSKKRKELIEDEIINIGLVKKSDVDQRRKEFSKYVKKLIDENKIFYSTGKDEYIY